MKRCLLIGFALVALAASTFAEARPPTVMNSPGYDRRLQESRSQLGTPTAPATTPVVVPKRSKQKHSN